jgi:hypothetical protein
MKPATSTYVVAFLSLGLLACASASLTLPPNGWEDGGKPVAKPDLAFLQLADAGAVDAAVAPDLSTVIVNDLSSGPAPPPPDLRVPSLGTTGGTTSLTQYGNLSGGMPFNDACPAGQLLMGFTGSLASVGGYNGQIAAQCGIPQVAASGGNLVVHIALGAALPTRGLQGAQSWTRSCPLDEVVVGMGGRSGLLVDQLIFRCAPITIGAGNTVKVGPTDDLPAIGQTGGSAFPQTDCASGQVATVARIRAGDAIDAFGLACTAVSLQ